MTFPNYEEREACSWSEDRPLPDFRCIFSKVYKPSDISQHHLDSLNLSILPLRAVDDLLPLAPDGSSYLPSANRDDNVNETPFAFAGNFGLETAYKRKEFKDRLIDLKIDNDLAFRIITRTVPAGVNPPRLAWMRKFWEGLESMTPYWDCSLDQYYHTSNENIDGEKSAKRPRLQAESSALGTSNVESVSESEHVLATTDTHGTLETPEQKNNANVEEEKSSDHGCSQKPTKESAESYPRVRYKGRRTSTGRQMPDQFRTDTARAFVEGTIWPFGASVLPPRVMPLVQFDKLNLPVRQTAAVYRVPRDRSKARQGWLEGPILGLQVRTETDFEEDDPSKGRLDLLREIAALLQLAQERRREGKTETKPGEGKWWTTKPRWGGGAGGEVQNELGNSDILQAAEELLGAKRESSARREAWGSRNQKKKTAAMLWKELKCGKGFWDAKTDYTAIGKPPGSDYDEVC